MKCPVCHAKVQPLHVMRGDTLQLFNQAGYLLKKELCRTDTGIVKETCYHCGYFIGEYKY